MIVDPGKEFMGDVTSLFKKHNVTVQRSEAELFQLLSAAIIL